jgi:hypothetical protein
MIYCTLRHTLPQISRNSTALITNLILTTMCIKNLMQYWIKAKNYTATLRKNSFEDAVSRNGYFLKVHKIESV